MKRRSSKTSSKPKKRIDPTLGNRMRGPSEDSMAQAPQQAPQGPRRRRPLPRPRPSSGHTAQQSRAASSSSAALPEPAQHAQTLEVQRMPVCTRWLSWPHRCAGERTGATCKRRRSAWAENCPGSTPARQHSPGRPACSSAGTTACGNAPSPREREALRGLGTSRERTRAP